MVNNYLVSPELPSVRVRLVAFGRMGCFTPPYYKPENHTLSFMTPTAARGILDGILLDKMEVDGRRVPTMRNVITRITAIAHPDPMLRTRQGRIERVTINGVESKMDLTKNENLDRFSLKRMSSSDKIIQRAISILHAPAFLIESRICLLPTFFKVIDKNGKNIKSYESIFLRRVAQGRTFRPVSMGLSRFAAQIKEYEGESILPINEHIGPLIYDYVFDEDSGQLAYRRYFDAVVSNGSMDCDWLSGSVKLIQENETRQER